MSKAIFYEIECKDIYLSNNLKLFSVCVLLSMFVPTSLQPILFKIVGFPSPENWILSIQMK